MESLRPVPLSEPGRDEPSKSFAYVSVPAASKEHATLQPIRRKTGYPMTWSVRLALCVGGALALTLLAVLLFPYGRYLPEIEVALANASGRPARVASMRVALYPKPGLLLGDVRLGSERDEIRIAEIRLEPAIGMLLAARKIFPEVVVNGAALSGDVIAGLPALFAELSRPSSKTGIDRLALENAEVSFGGLVLPSMDGEVKLSADGQFQSVLLHSADRGLSLVAKPLEQGLDVELEGFGWRPSPASPFIFDSLNLKAVLDNGVLSISRMELHIFDGLIEGVAVLRADKMPSIVGDVTFKRVNATRFGGALGLGQQFNGETAGKMRFSTASDSWETIFSAIDADGEFTMHRGSVRGIDLTEAARSSASAPVQGGMTQFENLSGEIRLKPTNYQFSGLVLTSGLMQSTGTVEVSRDLKVSGRMELKMRGTVNQARIPIAIAGSLKSPTAQVGRGG